MLKRIVYSLVQYWSLRTPISLSLLRESLLGYPFLPSSLLPYIHLCILYIPRDQLDLSYVRSRRRCASRGAITGISTGMEGEREGGRALGARRSYWAEQAVGHAFSVTLYSGQWGGTLARSYSTPHLSPHPMGRDPCSVV